MKAENLVTARRVVMKCFNNLQAFNTSDTNSLHI